MQTNDMDVTDLLANESFLNYCKKSSPDDIAYWETYIQENPDRQALVAFAMNSFVELFNALAESDREEQEARLKNSLNFKDPVPVVPLSGWIEKKPVNIVGVILKATAAAAVLVIGVFIALHYYNSGNSGNTTIFFTAYGEKKNIQLPDGSIVNLNAGSKIEIDKTFGVNMRNVYLEGEAFFDVKHNARLPFIVHTHAMDVMALGTAFNVKAYLQEKITETSLIRGLVEVTFKEGGNRKLLLHANEKTKWEQPLEIENATTTTAAKREKEIPADELLKKLVTTDQGDIKEIAWTENKLIFEDDTLSDIAVLLERWYGIKIEFNDDSIRNYRFTGLFEKEDVSTVLSFLRESKHFNFKTVNGSPLIISLSK